MKPWERTPAPPSAIRAEPVPFVRLTSLTSQLSLYHAHHRHFTDNVHWRGGPGNTVDEPSARLAEGAVGQLHVADCPFSLMPGFNRCGGSFFD